MRVILRGYIEGKLVFQEHMDAQALEAAIQSNIAMLADKPNLVEMEFLDEPDPEKRFFRIGTNPSDTGYPIPFKP